MWEDFCFKQNCFIAGFWTIVILGISSLLVWLFIFRGEKEVSYFRRWMGAIAFIGAALVLGLTMIAFWYWPSYFSMVIATGWILFLVYLAWIAALEPLCFRISQEFSRIFGW